jgi:hypothetical protein
MKISKRTRDPSGGMMNAQHSKASVEWGTPEDTIERSRRALGGRIELDPMSGDNFNQYVRAERIFTKEMDGLSMRWEAETLFLNPAGGLIRQAWEKLCTAVLNGSVNRAIWIGFSMEQLCRLADCAYHPLQMPTVIVRKRLKFRDPASTKDRPTHGNYITGINIEPHHFKKCFGDLGFCNI